jgi:hypothetical protein
MKNKNLIGLVLVLIFIIISAINPTVNAEPSIMVTNYEIYPAELMPGDTGILTLYIQNSENQATISETYGDSSHSQTTVENVGVVVNRIWLNPDYDVNGNKIKSTVGVSGYEDFGNIAPGTSFQVLFEIIAEVNISEGNYFPKINIDLKDDGNGNYEDVSFPIGVRVSNETVDLIQTNVPSKISIGGSTEISLNVVNKRKNVVESITISSNDNNSMNFNPESIFIGTLEAGESEEIILSLNPKEIGDKILSFNLTFNNGDNINWKKYEIPIEIIEVLDVAPIFTNIPYSIKKGASSRIGVIITPITDATVIPSQYFIGAMDPDDVFSASFEIYTNQLDYGNQSIQFKVSYKQDGEYYETSPIEHNFKITSEKGTSYQSSTNRNSIETSAFGEEFFNICIIVIGVIVVLIIVFILFKWKKGRKNQ